VILDKSWGVGIKNQTKELQSVLTALIAQR